MQIYKGEHGSALMTFTIVDLLKQNNAPDPDVIALDTCAVWNWQTRPCHKRHDGGTYRVVMLYDMIDELHVHKDRVSAQNMQDAFAMVHGIVDTKYSVGDRTLINRSSTKELSSPDKQLLTFGMRNARRGETVFLYTHDKGILKTVDNLRQHYPVYRRHLYAGHPMQQDAVPADHQ